MHDRWHKPCPCTSRVIWRALIRMHSSFAPKRNRICRVSFGQCSGLVALINTRALECNFSHSITSVHFLQFTKHRKQKSYKKNSTKTSFMDCDWTHQLCHPNQVFFDSRHSSYTCFVSHFTRFNEHFRNWIKCTSWFTCWWWFLFW